MISTNMLLIVVGVVIVIMFMQNNEYLTTQITTHSEEPHTTIVTHTPHSGEPHTTTVTHSTDGYSSIPIGWRILMGVVFAIVVSFIFYWWLKYKYSAKQG